MKIEILIPVALPETWQKVAVDRYAKYASPSTALHCTDLTGLIEGSMNYSQAPRLVLRNALKAEENGADACIIDCFTDPALGACSSQLEIPTVGVGMAGMIFAFAVSKSFAIITSESKITSLIEANAHRYGVTSRLQSVTSIDIPVEAIPKNLEKTMSRLLTAAKKLLGRTSTFVMGCTELAEMAEPLCQELRLLEARTQVINPIGAAMRLAETRVMLGNTCPGKGRLSDFV